ncbi:MAG: tetratricopeptide repeat protein [Candidatus Omnitrophica bacterium]|nr:tetratricopeptide repeat protein [Candidatus Omnitrophota bacterium]
MKNNYRYFKFIGLFILVMFMEIFHMNLFAEQDKILSTEEKIQKAKEHYLRGKQLIETQDFQAADEEFKKAQILLESPSLELQTLVGSVKEDKAPVTEESQEAELKSGGETAVTLARTAMELDQKNQYEEAITFYLKAIQLQPQNSNLYYNLGVEYIKINQYAQAEESFKMAVKLNPKDKDAYYNLGILYDSYLINKKEAINCYLRYLKLASNKEEIKKIKQRIEYLKKGLGIK